jgi:hypothetical protein
MTTADQHAVGAPRECIEDELRIDAAGAHQPDNSNVGGVPKTGNARQIGCGVRTPITKKSDDARFPAVG